MSNADLSAALHEPPASGAGAPPTSGSEGLLELRLAAVEADHLTVCDQIRLLNAKADRHASALDRLDHALAEVSTTTAEQPNTPAGTPPGTPADAPADLAGDAMTAAMTQRQARLDAQRPKAARTEGTATSSGPPARQVAAPDLDTLHDWVDRHLAGLTRKTTTTGEGGGIRWCRTWWLHPDAVERFTAIYLAFAKLSQETSPLWLSMYLRDHLDTHLAVLTSPFGPFHACTPHRHSAAIEPLGHAELAATSISGGTDDRTDGRTVDG